VCQCAHATLSAHRIAIAIARLHRVRLPSEIGRTRDR
jgi:hypothetical protein